MLKAVSFVFLNFSCSLYFVFVCTGLCKLTKITVENAFPQDNFNALEMLGKNVKNLRVKLWMLKKMGGKYFQRNRIH